jgi:hypothetical protein
MGTSQITTKVTKDTKGLDDQNSALRPKAFGRQAEFRALRVLRGEKVFPIWLPLRRAMF